VHEGSPPDPTDSSANLRKPSDTGVAFGIGIEGNGEQGVAPPRSGTIDGLAIVGVVEGCRLGRFHASVVSMRRVGGSVDGAALV
jgi:hypothetical protein